MGYVIVFLRLGRGFEIYHDLVRDYRKDHPDNYENSTMSKSQWDKWWKEREEDGLNASLSWLTMAMERRGGFDLKFLTEDFAIFQRRTWFQNLLKWLGIHP